MQGATPTHPAATGGSLERRELRGQSESVAALRAPRSTPSTLPERAELFPSADRSLGTALTEKPAAQNTKEHEILDVATVHFLRDGYRGSSINAMARSSGISKESIYRYFSSKKELFDAVIERELVACRDALRWRVATLKSMDLRAALTTIATVVLTIGTTERALALQRLIAEETVSAPAVGRRYFRFGPGQTYAALKQLFASREVQSDFDAAALSRHLLALLLWRVGLERYCAVRPALSRTETASIAAATVDDFMRAFLRSSQSS